MRHFLATIVLLAALLGAVQAPSSAIASGQQTCTSNGHTWNMSRTMYLGQTMYMDLRYEQCHWLSYLWHDYSVWKMPGPQSYASVSYYGQFTYIAYQRGFAAMSVCYEESSGHWYEADDDYCFIVTIRVL